MSSILSLQVNDPRHVVTGGLVVSNPNAAYNKKQRENLFYVLPRSAPAAGMFASSGGQVIFDLPHNVLDELDMMNLVFTITNTNGAAGALHPVDGYTLIDNIEVSNRGVPVQTQYGQALRKIMLLTNPSEKSGCLLKQANLNPITFVPVNTVADAASLTYRIPLPTMLNTCQVPLWREENQWRITITFKGSTDAVLSTTVATAAQISLSGMKLLLDGVQFEESVRRAYDAELEASGDIYYKFVEGSRDPISLGTTVDGTVVQSNYTQTGNLSFAFLDMRTTTGTNQTQYVALDLDTAELLQSGKVISHGLGDNAFTYDVSKYTSATHWPNPLLLETQNAFIVSFSDDPSAAISTGASHGHYRINGNSEVWRVTPGASGTHQLWVFGYWHGYMKCNYATGQIRIERKPLEY